MQFHLELFVQNQSQDFGEQFLKGSVFHPIVPGILRTDKLRIREHLHSAALRNVLQCCEERSVFRLIVRQTLHTFNVSLTRIGAKPCEARTLSARPTARPVKEHG